MGGGACPVVRPIVALLVLLAAGPAPVLLSAHPLHTSFTDVTRDRTGAITLSVRLFADDFGAVVDSLRSLPAYRGESSDAIVRRYFEQSVTLRSKTGAPLRLVWSGMRTGDNLIWLSARTIDPAPRGVLRLRNALMFDRFADQISIVRWTGSSGVRTLVLSASAAEAVFE
jgi:hypothetical protein